MDGIFQETPGGYLVRLYCYCRQDYVTNIIRLSANSTWRSGVVLDHDLSEI